MIFWCAEKALDGSLYPLRIIHIFGPLREWPYVIEKPELKITARESFRLKSFNVARM